MSWANAILVDVLDCEHCAKSKSNETNWDFGLFVFYNPNWALNLSQFRTALLDFLWAYSPVASLKDSTMNPNKAAVWRSLN